MSILYHKLTQILKLYTNRDCYLLVKVEKIFLTMNLYKY